MEEELRETVEKYAGEVQKLMAYRGNRTCFPVNAKIVLYPKTYQGQPPVYLCIANDISAENFLEKKVGQVEEEAKAAAKVKSEFVANVTHGSAVNVNAETGSDAQRRAHAIQSQKTVTGDVDRLAALGTKATGGQIHDVAAGAFDA